MGEHRFDRELLPWVCNDSQLQLASERPNGSSQKSPRLAPQHNQTGKAPNCLTLDVQASCQFSYVWQISYHSLLQDIVISNRGGE